MKLKNQFNNKINRFCSDRDTEYNPHTFNNFYNYALLS